MDSLKLFVHPFVLVNLSVLAIYPLIRSNPDWNSQYFPDAPPHTFAPRELEIGVSTLVVTLLKARKAVTKEGYFSRIFNFLKLGEMVLFAIRDPRLGAAYALLCLIVQLCVPLPAGADEQAAEKAVVYLTPAQFDAWVVNSGGDGDNSKASNGEESSVKNRSKKKKKTTQQYWLVEFYVTWSSECTEMARVFAQLALAYACGEGSAESEAAVPVGDGLRFAKIDVARYPGMASRFGINTNVTSKQLPTFVLFTNGVETKRIPEVSSKGTVLKVRVDGAILEKEFELANLRSQVLAKGGE